jgi:hypothetical protein
MIIKLPVNIMCGTGCEILVLRVLIGVVWFWLGYWRDCKGDVLE